MAHDVFISYSSRDKPVADSMCATLESRKIRCWIAPRDIPVGQSWTAALVEAIGQSRVFVLILSNGSNKSPQVLREVGEAMDKGIPAIPFRIDDVQPSKELGYYIRGIHWLDAMTPPLENHLKSLADTVTVLLAAPGVETPPVETPVALQAKVAAPRKSSPLALRTWALTLVLLALVCGILVLGNLGISLLKGGAFKIPAWLFPGTPMPTHTQAPSVIWTVPPTIQDTQVVTTQEIPPATSISTAASPVQPGTQPPAGTPWQGWTQVQSFPAPETGSTGIIRAGDRLWVIVPCSKYMYGLDLKGNMVTELETPEIQCSMGNGGLAWDGKSLWVSEGSEVVQIDPANGWKLPSFYADLTSCSIAWDGSSLWLVDREGNLSVYNPSGQRQQRLSIPVFGVVSGIAWVNGELWMLNEFGDVTRFDHDLNKVDTFSLSAGCGISAFHQQKSYGLFWDGTALWVADAVNNRIYQCAPGG